MRGFQLWINLPAAEKMKPAHYQDIPAEQIPTLNLPQGGTIKVIAGTVTIAGKTVAGAINSGNSRLTTDPLYLDVTLPADAQFAQPVPASHNAFVYVYEGDVTVGSTAQSLATHTAGLFDTQGDGIFIQAGARGTRFLLLAGKPLREPMVQYGPFVMNSREEIEHAIRDYQSGTFVSP